MALRGIRIDLQPGDVEDGFAIVRSRGRQSGMWRERKGGHEQQASHDRASVTVSAEGKENAREAGWGQVVQGKCSEWVVEDEGNHSSNVAVSVAVRGNPTASWPLPAALQ